MPNPGADHKHVKMGMLEDVSTRASKVHVAENTRARHVSFPEF